MKPKDYIKLALRTESKNKTPRVEHAVMGIVTEAGEFMTAIKKHKIYAQNLDKVNLIEEAGDLFWYLALLCDELGVDFETVWDINIKN